MWFHDHDDDDEWSHFRHKHGHDDDDDDQDSKWHSLKSFDSDWWEDWGEMGLLITGAVVVGVVLLVSVCCCWRKRSRSPAPPPPAAYPRQETVPVQYPVEQPPTVYPTGTLHSHVAYPVPQTGYPNPQSGYPNPQPGYPVAPSIYPAAPTGYQGPGMYPAAGYQPGVYPGDGTKYPPVNPQYHPNAPSAPDIGEMELPPPYKP